MTDFEDGLSVSSVKTAIGNAGGVLLGILVAGLLPDSPNPDPASYAIPVFRNGLLKFTLFAKPYQVYLKSAYCLTLFSLIIIFVSGIKF